MRTSGQQATSGQQEQTRRMTETESDFLTAWNLAVALARPPYSPQHCENARHIYRRAAEVLYAEDFRCPFYSAPILTGYGGAL